jgi:ATP-dependent protease HslVU (ClpYQ) ATPase subunit
MAELDDSAIYLEDGTELLGTRHRLKTRRQRIIEQISFETDSHNIYDPYFTSEEEGS